VFPDDRFYVISFATWPRPPSLPKELSPQMVARVQHGNSVQPIRNVDDLKIFLSTGVKEARGNERIQAATLAALRLAEAVSKAGGYQFDKPDVSIARGKDGIEAAATASVGDPARGAVTIQLQFAFEGTISPDRIHIEDRTNPGPPPRR
jgi:hypothetical protein